MQIRRVFDILYKLNNAAPKEDLLASKTNGSWHKYSSTEVLEQVNILCYALMQLGLRKGDKVAIISNNRPEWNFVDFACQQLNLISVPVFPTASPKDLTYILNDAEVKLVFVSSKEVYARLAGIQDQVPDVKLVYSFNTIEGLPSFQSLTALGKEHPNPVLLKEISDAVTSEDLFTILYTSGTTGVPKGVMLNHRNLISNVEATQSLAPFAPHWRALSFLPLNHVLERMIVFLYLYRNVSVYYAEGIETIGDNLREIKPHIFVTVPRLLERVYDKLISAGEKLTGLQKKIFFWAVDIALNYEADKSQGFLYDLKRKIADKLVYSKWRQALGGNMVCIACGGAALQSRLAKVFSCAGITILEGYGLTETAVVVAVNSFRPGAIKIGTVGMVHDNTQVKIAEDGEILVKSPSIMMGYYKKPEATKEVIDQEGWFHTGDIGTFIDGKFLKITDRKKEIFKTTSGKYVAPLAIENKLKECRFVEQCMVIGENQKFASALIVPDFEYIKEWCARRNIPFTGKEEMIKNEEIKSEINRFIREMNKNLAPYEQIKRPEILLKQWTVDDGELTPKLSLKRKVILEKNKEVISKIYEKEE